MGRIKTEMEVVIDSSKIISAVVSRGIVRARAREGMQKPFKRV
jgi:hypothetical protein